jgi:glucose/arabinose dehydrogenase
MTGNTFDGVDQNEVWLTVAPVPGLPGVIALGSHNGHMEAHRVNDFGVLPTKLSTIHSLGSKATTLEKPSNEQGMLGMAFHKKYQENGRVFVSYTCGDVSYCGRLASTVVEEYRVKDRTDPTKLVFDTDAPKKIVFTTPQPKGNHNGGQVLFSPDERDPHLYIMVRMILWHCCLPACLPVLCPH